MLRKSALAGVVTGALMIGGLGFTAPATAATPNQAATAAVSWLQGEINDNDLLGSTATPDLTATLQMGVGLSRTALAPSLLTRLKNGMDAQVADYVGTSGDAAKAGRVALAASFYARAGDPANADGLDLVSQLEAVVDDSTGALATSWGDEDLFNQSSAVDALHQAGSDEAAQATDYLVIRRCTEAGWGYWLDATTCISDVDTTALAITALADQKSAPDVAAAIAEGSAWLAAQAATDGSYGLVEGDWPVPYNTNSTGLAAWALAQGGQNAVAAKAATWVRAHQVGLVCDQGLASETGAITYSDEALEQDLKPGLASRSEVVSATAQAFPALTLAPVAGGAPTVTGPKFAKAGSKISVTVTGLAAGERACLTGLGAAITGTGGALTFSVPAVANQDIMLTPLTGSAQARTVVLGKQKLKVKAPKKAKRGAKVKVRVKGLVKGEKVVVKVAGKKAAQGKANNKGVFAKKVKIAKKLKPGKKVKVKVTGQFGNRTGKTTLRVR